MNLLPDFPDFLDQGQNLNSKTLRSNFAANLKRLCSLRSSIADVCRATGINRQQFNRYLAGTSVPSALIMRRICELFGVSEEMLFRQPNDFRDRMDSGKLLPVTSKLLRDIGVRLPTLATGYYFCYQLSTRPGPPRVLRKLLHVHTRQGGLWFRGRCSFFDAGHKPPGVRHESFFGSILGLDNFNYFIEGYAPDGGGMSFAVFGAPASGSSQMRAGLQLHSCNMKRGVGRAALEYLGERTNLRKALRGCGYLPLGAPELGTAILDLIMPLPGESVSGLDGHPNILR